MDYMSPAGTNLIRKWSRGLSIQSREYFETLLSILAKQKQWEYPHYKPLSGRHLKGVGEIRFKSEHGTPLRVAGMKSSVEGQYILLVGFSHKGTVFKPPDALELASKRKRLLENREGDICEHEEDDGETEEE